MAKKKKPEIPKDVKALIDEFAKTLFTVEDRVLLPSVIEYLMEKLGYSGNPAIKPLFIFTKALPELVLGTSKKYWANLRAAKRGPKFYLTGEKMGTPVCKVSDVENYLTSTPVETMQDDY